MSDSMVNSGRESSLCETRVVLKRICIYALKLFH